METVECNILVLVQALDAMVWTFNPYLDYIEDPKDSIHDFPWIVELITSYNLLVQELPQELRYEYKMIEF